MFSIVDELRETDAAGVTELSERLGLSKSNVHHHLSTMRERGFVVKRDNGDYSIGLEFFSVGFDARNRHPIYQPAKENLPQLAKETGETSWCMIEENNKGILIDGYASETSLNPNAAIGTWKPLHCSSTGKAILANLPAERREAILDTDSLPAMTEHSTTDPEAVREELKEIRNQGFAINLGEDIPGIHTVGTPIFDGTDTLVGSISAGGAANRLTEEYCVDELAPLVKATADDIELSIVYN
ncbi:IclR family transcriptional regulator [Halostagnicola bangensis]